MQLNPKISGDFRPSEQIFPQTGRWVPLTVQDDNFSRYFVPENQSLPQAVIRLKMQMAVRRVGILHLKDAGLSRVKPHVRRNF